jgi:hypothetical protein
MTHQRINFPAGFGQHLLAMGVDAGNMDPLIHVATMMS